MKLRVAAVLSAMLVVNACGGGGGPSGPPGGGTPTTGSLRGTVNDQDGAAVPNASVALSATGQTTRNTVTAANGTYTFNSLPVGTYTVAVTPPTGYQLGAGTGMTTVSVVAGQQANASVIVLSKNPTAPPPLAVAITMVDNAFQPQSAEIGVGGTVTFTNNGPSVHNATGGTAISTGNLNPGASANEVMQTVGTFNYNCTLHAGMSGTIIVRPITP
jgi:plastocyanin